MPVPRHEDILKTLRSNPSKYGGTKVSLGGDTQRSSGLPSHEDILNTIKSNPSRFKVSDKTISSMAKKKETVTPEPEKETEEKKSGFFDRLKEIGAHAKAGLATLPAIFKGGASVYLSKNVVPELGEDRLLKAQEQVVTTMKEDLAQGKLETKTVRVPKEDASLKDWLTGKQYTEVEMTPEEQVARQEKILEDQKNRELENVTPEEQLAQSARVSFKKAEEERQKVLETYGQADKWTGRWVVNEVAYNAPQFVSSFGLGVATAVVTKNPAAAFAAGFSSSYLQEAGSAYNQAIDAGVSEQQAQDIGNNVGMINAVIEQIPLGRAINKSPAGDQLQKKLTQKIVDSLLSKAKQGLLEGSTESIQEIVNNAWQATYQENPNLLEGIPEAFLIGTIFGIGGDVISPDGSRINTNELTSVINPDAPANARILVEDAINTPENQRTDEQQDLVTAAMSRSLDEDLTPTEALRKLREPVEGTPGIETSLKEFTERQRGLSNKVVSALESEASSIDIAEGKQRFYQIASKTGDTPWLWGSKEEFTNWVQQSLNVGEEVRAVDLDPASVTQQSNGAFVANEGVSIEENTIAAITADEDLIVRVGKGEDVVKPVEQSPAFQEAYSQVFAELDVAEAGQRIPTESGETIGVPSTFPAWIPEHLRSKSLFEKVLPMIDPGNDTVPKANATRQQELYDVLQEEIATRTGDIRATEAEVKTGTEERQLKQGLGDERFQQERSETETLDRILPEDVVKADPTYIKGNMERNLNTIVEASEDIDSIPPGNSTQTVKQSWSGEFSIPQTTKWQGFRRLIEDMNIRLKTLNNSIEEFTGDAIPEQLDLWAMKDMLPRKQSDQIRRIRATKQDFVERLVADGITVEELDEYRHALHAKERNEEMNRRRKEIGKEPVDGLSGMTDEEANEILSKDNKKMDPYVKELKKMDQDTLNYMVKNGLLKAEEAKKIGSAYKNYAPLFRDMSEDYTGIGTGQGIATPRSLIKRAKGSERRVLSTIGNTFHRAERIYSIKLKNDIGKTIVDMTKRYPFLKDNVFTVEKDPVGVLAKRELKAEVDQQFIDELVGFSEGLGLEVFERQGQAGRKLGYYSTLENKVVRKFATSRETLAHEIGHFLDIRKGLGKRVVANEDIAQEIYKHSELEVGETPTRLANPKERFANAFSWWLVHRDLAAESMPKFHEAITNVIENDSDLRPIMDIKPTAKPTLESITEDVWGRVFKVGQNVILTKIDGSEYFITVKEESLARALKNTNLARVPSWARTFRTALSIWSGFKTRWRPEFLITNFQRDVGEGMINLGVEQAELGDAGKGLKIDVAKGIPQAQKEIWGYLRGEENATADKFFKDGGDTGHFWLEPVQDAEQSLIQLQKEIQNVGVEKLKNPVRKAGEFIDDVQTMVELGIRYSAYKELVNRGMSPERAVQAAADLTVNFSRQGEMSPVLKSAYGFINPAIQGTSKVIRSVASKKGRTRIAKSMGAMTMLGFFIGSLSKLIDEEGDEQMSEWTKNHKLAFSIGNGKEVNLWSMPYGYTTFYAMGRQLSDVVWGTKDIDEAASQVAETTVNSFSPFGTKLNDLWPTLLKPIADINNNDAWYDGKIHPDQIFTKTPKPNSATYFKNTSEISIFIAEVLNQLTGGDEETRGLIDIHPDDLEYMYDQYFGGPFEFVTSTLESAATSVKGEFDPNRTPFVRQFYREGNTQSWSYGVIYDTLEIAYKTDLSETQKNRFYRAVDTGVEEGVFDQSRADGYVRDFVRAIYKIEGSLVDKDNEDALGKLSEADEEDAEKLINTYAISTQRTIRRRLKQY